jgi:hypothetical protein
MGHQEEEIVAVAVNTSVLSNEWMVGGTHLSHAKTALTPAKAARCSGRSSFAVPLVPVEERRVERREEAYRGIEGFVVGGKKATNSGARFDIVCKTLVNEGAGRMYGRSWS